MVREDKHGHVKRRLVAPPTLPVGVVRVGVKTEHSGTHDLGTNPFEVGRCIAFVHSGRARARRVVEHPLTKGPGGGVGRSELGPVVAERILRRATFGRGVTVQRNVQVDPYSHGKFLLQRNRELPTTVRLPGRCRPGQWGCGRLESDAGFTL